MRLCFQVPVRSSRSLRGQPKDPRLIRRKSFEAELEGAGQHALVQLGRGVAAPTPWRMSKMPVRVAALSPLLSFIRPLRNAQVNENERIMRKHSYGSRHRYTFGSV